MTEFKKLTALTEALSRDVASLKVSCSLHDRAGLEIARGPNSDVETLHALALQIRESSLDGAPRLRKIVQKARETDPNRQIYNEAMCLKIEKLFASFCEALGLLAPSFFDGLEKQGVSAPEEDAASHVFDGVLDPHFDMEALLEASAELRATEDVYNVYILQRAKAEAWQSRVAQGLSEVVAFEAQNRALVVAEERMTRSALTEDKRADKMRVIAVLEERAEAKWQAELQRRSEELKRFKAAAAAVDDVAAVPSFLEKCIPDALLRAVVAGNAHQLIKALLSTPEDLNIRRLRNNNEHLLCDYGHPCLSAHDSSAAGERCVCRAVTAAAEVLWCRMGYTIRYTKVPNRSLDVLRGEARAQVLCLPCGRSFAAHTYAPLGFEEYSERLLELAEPDAMERADEWMQWYNTMQDLQSALATMAAQPRR